jgi:two-component system, NarL family, nitrate/nitrite response regulator NarL
MGQGDSSLETGSRVLFVDRPGLFRELFCRYLRNTAPELTLVEANSVGELDSNAIDSEPSLILLVYDSDYQSMGVKALLDPLMERYPQAPVAVMSRNDDPDSALEAIRSGAKGFISTLVRSQAIVPALRVLLAGGEFVLTTALIATPNGKDSSNAKGDHALPHSKLSPREREVFHLLKQGKPNKVIASDLSVAENTVKVHVRNILKKMKARSRVEVLMAKPSMPHRRIDP